MDYHKECSLCFTLVYERKNERLHQIPVTTDYINENMSFDSLLKGNAHINAQSYLIRKSDFDKYIDFDFFVKKFNLWDYPIVLELIQHTKFHCLPFYSAVNNVREESVTNTKSRKKRAKYIYAQFKIQLYFIKKYGCKFSTKVYLIYRLIRRIYSIGAKRWM